MSASEIVSLAPSFGEVWRNLTGFLEPNISGSQETDEMIGFLHDITGSSSEVEGVLLQELQQWFFKKLNKELRYHIAPKFWSSLQGEITPELLVSSVSDLIQMVQGFFYPVNKLQRLVEKTRISSDLQERTHLSIRVAVFSNPPQEFRSAVKAFYSKAFKVHHLLNKKKNKTVEDEDDAELATCEGCDCAEENCQCQQFLDSFCSWNSMLHSLGVLKKVVSDAFVSVIHSEVNDKINQTCQGEYDVSFLALLMEWLEEVVLEWMRNILPPKGTDKDDFDVTIVESWTPRLQYFLYKTYAELRIEELFGIIVDYPDSLKALEDLKECLEKTDLRSHLIKSLRSSFETRLLHPGAETTDILTQYVSAIRALRILDPSGVILENVCEPVKSYLRTRDDTVRCIVTSLTDENCTDLSEELLQGDSKGLEGQPLDSDNEDEEDWTPDPIDADPTKTSRSRKSSDIISMLVNIYGSRDLFVSEYRTLLADRILSSFNYDIAKELRYLELLKLRFGESHLQFCEVMLKDVADSRRMNTNIHSKIEAADVKPDIDVHAMVLSNVFWPAFREEKLELPEQVKSSMDNYTEQFKSLKGSRTLLWKPHLGLVDLDLELEDRTLSFTVPPARAATIMYFQQKPRWNLDELSGAMHMASGALRRCLGFWLGQGILKQESQDTYVVLEKSRGGQEVQGKFHKKYWSTVPNVVDFFSLGESAMATSQAQREGELQIYWSYIVGMLTNLDSLPLDRIHSMLRMFAMSGPNTSQCNVEDVKRFLERKVREGELQYVSGKYRLAKPGR